MNTPSSTPHGASTQSFSQLGMASYDASLLINNSHKAFNALLKMCLGHHGLTIPQWSLLGRLYRQDSLRPNEIAKSMGVKAPFASTLINHLQSEGLLQITIVEDDERGKELSLTTKGYELVERVEPLLNDCLNGQFGGVSEQSLQAYFVTAKYMAAHVKHH